MKPYRVRRDIDRYSRRVIFASPYWVPAVVLRASCDVRAAEEHAKAAGTNLHTVFIKALSMALRDFPGLDHFCIDGRIAHAGPGARVSTVVEEEALNECTEVVISDAHMKDLKTLSREIRVAIRDSRQRKAPSLSCLMNLFPRLTQRFRMLTGGLVKEIRRTQAPVLLTMLGYEGIELFPSGVAYSTIVAPSTVEDGRCFVNFGFNHQLTNARPIAAFAARFKEIVEGVRGL